MPNIPERWDGENQWYFVTVVTNYRRQIFLESGNCRKLLLAFQEVRSYHSFRLGGLVILPDHWHGLIHPEGKEVIESVVSAIKKNYLIKMRGTAKSVSIWQARFLDRRIRNEQEFNHYIEYIRINPVKHQHVDSYEKWPWGFIHANPFGQIEALAGA